MYSHEQNDQVMTKPLLISHKWMISIVALLVGFSLSNFPAKLQPLAPGEYITALDWDSDGSRLAYGTGQVLLPWADIKAGLSQAALVERGGDEQFALSFSHSIVNVEIDPTGQTLLVFDLFVNLVDMQTGQLNLRRNPGSIAFQTGTWNPSTGSLLITTIYGSLVYDTTTWENLSYFGDFLLPSGRFSEGQRMADSIWSPDGIHVASSTTFGPIYVWDSSNLEGVLKATFTGHSASVQDAVWSPDGTLIASGDADGRVFVWNAQTGAVVTELVGHTDVILDIDWRSDGQRVITTSLDGTMRAWTWPSGAMTIVQSGAIVSAVAYSPDGTELAYGGLVPPDSPPEVVITDTPEILPAEGTR
ncbi:MAG: WD40 repeat domain-containing protein [Chloroflexi bacterium]|nr:WD40 repeat domain-containing protein [Chloroflexota bacterium]